MRVIVAPDKFKGSLTAAEVATAIADGLRASVPDVEVVTRPIADGGDGTVAAVLSAGFEVVGLTARGPTGIPGPARYARRGSTAVIELAEICGLLRLPDWRPDPLGATTLGVGDAVRHALATGCSTIVLGVGGSASTDGGAGLLVALGARLLDAAGRYVPPGGGGLAEVAAVDLSGLMPDVAAASRGSGRAVTPAHSAAELVVACDVDSPLYGSTGAAHVFAPQKGATAEQVELLDAGLRHWARILGGAAVAEMPGSGAAGGIGFAARTVLGGALRPGVALVLDLIGFAGDLRSADLVITGEGSLDEQTLAGKAPVGVAGEARRAGVRCVAISGRTLIPPSRLRTAGIDAAYSLTDFEPDPDRCMADARRLVTRVAEVVGLRELDRRLSSGNAPGGTR